jgi:hypothetical protein
MEKFKVGSTKYERADEELEVHRIVISPKKGNTNIS